LLRRSFAATAALVAALAAPALAADYAVDPAHTQAEFTVTHLAISHVRGQIPLVSGTISLGANDVPTAIAATLSVKDIDTHDASRDKDMRGSDWFETDKFPTMTFVAKKITGTAQNFSVVGDLTFHGVTKSVTLAAKEEGRVTDARGRTHVGYTATTTIDRRDWGLNWGKTTPGGSLIAANDVSINLNVEAVSK
jgi:polyisoprenoid-binding protein YceI